MRFRKGNCVFTADYVAADDDGSSIVIWRDGAAYLACDVRNNAAAEIMNEVLRKGFVDLTNFVIE